jgi:lipopolysaccharide export system permease protein
LPVAGFIGEQSAVRKSLHHLTIGELLTAKRALNEQSDELSQREIRSKKTLINTQISMNVANAVGIFAMSLLAVPLGIGARRSEKAINIVVALLICFGYYFAMITLSWLGDKPKLRPDILLWLPNAIVAAIGIVLFRRASQH